MVRSVTSHFRDKLRPSFAIASPKKERAQAPLQHALRRTPSFESRRSRRAPDNGNTCGQDAKVSPIASAAPLNIANTSLLFDAAKRPTLKAASVWRRHVISPLFLAFYATDGTIRYALVGCSIVQYPNHEFLVFDENTNA
jgi:hypothetical protein